MDTVPGSSGGLMVVSAWLDSPGELRIRLTSSGAVDSGPTETTYAADTAEALRIVERWLEGVAVR